MAEVLGEHATGWVRSLRRLAPSTVLGYVSDMAGWCETWNDIEQRDPCTPDKREPTPKGVGESAWARLQASAWSVPLSDFTPRSCVRVIEELSAEHSPASVRRSMTAFSSLCRYLVLEGALESSPMDHPAVTAPRMGRRLPKALAEEQARSMLEAAGAGGRRGSWPERDMALACLLLGCGLRASEAAAARWGDIVPDSSQSVLHVRGKGSKDRVIPLTPEVMTILERFRIERGRVLGDPKADDYIVCRKDGSSYTTRSLRRIVTSWYRQAGFRPPERSSVHAFRHTFATFAVADGAPLPDVQELLGHATLETTRVYLSVTSQGLAQTMSGHRSRGLLREQG